MRLALVSSFFAEITQQIHSLRARGVSSSQAFFTAMVASKDFFKSDGNL
jgi:hypothetical protein